MSKEVLFFLSLATAKRVSELQAFYSIVSFSFVGAIVSYVPEFFLSQDGVCLATPSSLLLG